MKFLKSLLSTIAGIFYKKNTVKVPRVPETGDNNSEVINVTDKYNQLVNEFIALTNADVGTKENPPYKNRGPLMDAICNFFGYKKGSSYCIGGQLYRLNQILKKYGLENPIKGTMSTQSFFKWAQENIPDFVHDASVPTKKGWICIQQNRTDSAHGHAYSAIEDEKEDGSQKTMEYNTDPNGSANSIGCFNLIRKNHRQGTSSKIFLGSVDVVGYAILYNENKMKVAV